MRKLSRSKLGQISDAWDAGTLNAHTSPQTTPKQNHILAKNTTSGTLKTGSNVQISGFSGTLTYAQARQKMLNDSLVLTIASPSSSTDSEQLATTTETIQAGGIGTINASVTFAEISLTSSSDVYATAAGTSQASSTGAAYAILAKSGTNTSGNAICALAKLGGGGGGTSGQSGTITYISSLSVTNGVLIATPTTTTVLIPN